MKTSKNLSFPQLLTLLLLFSTARCMAGATNAIGYYRVVTDRGLSTIANSLDHGVNTLDEVLPAVVDGTQLYKFNPATRTYDVDEFMAGWGWIENLSLAPGDGAWIYSPVRQTNLFVGEWRQANPAPRRPPGWYLVGPRVPAAATFEEALGYPPQVGDRLVFYQGAYTNFPTPPNGASSIHTFGPTGWNTPPTFSIGKSFYLELSSGTNTVPINLPPLTMRHVNQNIELAWPSQSMNIVLESATSIQGPWSLVGQINPLRVPPINNQQFFRLASASPLPPAWDLDGDRINELEQRPEGLAYSTGSGYATLAAQRWAVVQRNNGFNIYVASGGHIDYGYELKDLNGDSDFGDPGELDRIPAPDAPAVCIPCSPNFKILASIWRDTYAPPNGWVARNTLSDLRPGAYVTLKVDGTCASCQPCWAPISLPCITTYAWNIQPNNPAAGSGYSYSGDTGTFYADRANAFQIAITVTCTCPWDGAQSQQVLNFSVSWR